MLYVVIKCIINQDKVPSVNIKKYSSLALMDETILGNILHLHYNAPGYE